MKNQQVKNTAIFKIPVTDLDFFSKMAQEFYNKGAIQKPNVNALAKIALLYLGEIYKQDRNKRSQSDDTNDADVRKQGQERKMLRSNLDKYW